MKKLVVLTLFVLGSILPINIFAVQNELVIAQMNSCVNTLTNIINNKSMTVLEHETDQLLNNLTMEQLIGLPEIADFRTDLIDGIGQLEITEEEKTLLKRLNSIKQNNLKWQVFSNALSNTMLITGGGNTKLQIGFQALVTAARTGVEYKTQQSSTQMEELQAMWELRKDNLETFIKLRKDALKIIFNLYQKYHLKEADRLTEQTAQQFQKIISDTNATRMVRLLLDNRAKFSHIPDYYYYLGVGYLDMKNVSKAMEAFTKYDELYSKAPIYRVNEKSGIISLARLANMNNLSAAQIEKELINAQKNLPSNSMAFIQCAAVYNTVLKNPKKALSVLRSALDDESTTDKAAIIITGSMILPKISSKSPEYREFLSAYSNQKTIDFDAALNICIANKYNIFKFLGNNFKISNYCNNSWFGGKAELNDNFNITCPKRYPLDLSKVQIFVEEKKDNDVTVTQYKLSDTNGIPLKKVNKVKAFKQNPYLKYLYLYSIGKDEFKIKDNIDYNSILNDGDNLPQSKFFLTEKDLKDIVKFLQSNEVKSNKNLFIAQKLETPNKTTAIQGIQLTFPHNYSAKSLYKHFKNQSDATYIKLLFNDSRNLTICYQFDNEQGNLVPCYTQYQGKIYFVNNSYLKKFGYASTKQPKQVSKRHVAKPQPKQQVKSEKPWWKFWGSDEKEQKKAAPQKKAQPKKVVNKTQPTKPVMKAQPKKVVKKAEPKKVVKKTETKKVVKKVEPKKEVKSKEKPWWKFWGSKEKDQKQATPQKKAQPKKVVHKTQPSKQVTKEQPKKVVKKAEPKKVVKKTETNKVVNKVEPKKEVKSKEKPWWKFWGSKEKDQKQAAPQKKAQPKKVVNKTQPSKQVTKAQPKKVVKKTEPQKEEKSDDKTWWKFWGSKN